MASNSDFKKGQGTVGEEASAFGQRVKGAVKEGAGKLTGNELLEQEGRIENASGNIRQATNDVIDTDRDYNSSTGFDSSFDRASGATGSTYGAGSTGSYGSSAAPRDGTVGEEVSAFGQRVKGAVKEGAGKLTGNERLEREGDYENKLGNARQERNDVIGSDRNIGSSTSAYGSRGPLVTGLYTSRDDAERAWSDLTTRHGYKHDDISVLMSDDTRKKHFAGAKPGEEFKQDTKAMEGLGVGSALGGTLGAIIGAIAAIGTNLVLPGAGLVVAGPLAAAFAGAGVGGVTGGLIGALVGAGIPEERAREYDQGIRNGGIVLGAHARDEKHASDLERHFQGYGGRQVIK